MTDFSIPSGRTLAHRGLPRWLCVYLACGYAESVVEGPEGEAAIAMARLWLRGQATDEDCHDAAIQAHDAADGPIAVEAASASAAFHAARSAMSTDPAEVAGYAANCAAYLLVSGPASLEAYYHQVITLLNRFELWTHDVQQPALDWLDEHAPSVLGERRYSR